MLCDKIVSEETWVSSSAPLLTGQSEVLKEGQRWDIGKGASKQSAELKGYGEKLRLVVIM